MNQQGMQLYVIINGKKNTGLGKLYYKLNIKNILYKRLKYTGHMWQADREMRKIWLSRTYQENSYKTPTVVDWQVTTKLKSLWVVDKSRRLKTP